jgi:hypothetical protein
LRRHATGRSLLASSCNGAFAPCVVMQRGGRPLRRHATGRSLLASSCNGAVAPCVFMQRGGRPLRRHATGRSLLAFSCNGAVAPCVVMQTNTSMSPRNGVFAPCVFLQRKTHHLEAHPFMNASSVVASMGVNPQHLPTVLIALSENAPTLTWARCKSQMSSRHATRHPRCQAQHGMVVARTSGTPRGWSAWSEAPSRHGDVQDQQYERQDGASWELLPMPSPRQPCAGQPQRCDALEASHTPLRPVAQ